MRAVRWRTAMAEALYGADGFYVRATADGGPAAGSVGHFRTSVHVSPLFGTALLRVIVAVDEALGRPDPFDVVDIGAGRGHLLRRLIDLAPTYLAGRLRLRAVELAAPPPGRPAEIAWSADLPPAGSLTGVVLATEWLDNVPLDVAELDPDGVLRYRLVDPAGGDEQPGDEVTGEDADWARRWWPAPAGTRVELGGSRDRAWADAVSTIHCGLALTVDYGHLRTSRPRFGTLTGFYAGRGAAAVPDGSRDITAHVAVDAVRAAGERIAGTPARLCTQREALTALGVDSARPPVELANRDPGGYVRALSNASLAAELTDPNGLGAHYWIVQPVGLDPESLPAGLRP